LFQNSEERKQQASNRMEQYEAKERATMQVKTNV
jgi:hypothetical protein